MNAPDRGGRLAEWLRMRYPEIFEAYERHLAEDSDQILRAWLHREHPDILTEYDLERYRESRESLY